MPTDNSAFFVGQSLTVAFAVGAYTSPYGFSHPVAGPLAASP
jgi:hypothetical protein